ncbi:hypothetical protein DFH08DRAFT_1013969 [Mycena albidolilacea]|uniref:Uncharacterized protein n=1 Tax=Mycena albidolilacea TaxID=1033008 RepID=A0AAD6ZTV0_9AGAR|nr:hypothetical protein DFH08DRAFT_1013969 [Mycena albidolilacea]
MCDESRGSGNKKWSSINGKEGRDTHAWGPVSGTPRSARFGTHSARQNTRWDGRVHVAAGCMSPYIKHRLKQLYMANLDEDVSGCVLTLTFTVTVTVGSPPILGRSGETEMDLIWMENAHMSLSGRRDEKEEGRDAPQLAYSQLSAAAPFSVPRAICPSPRLSAVLEQANRRDAREQVGELRKDQGLSGVGIMHHRDRRVVWGGTRVPLSPRLFDRASPNFSQPRLYRDLTQTLHSEVL